MIPVPMPFFVDYCLSPGPGRLKLVEHLKSGEGFVDMYRTVRDSIVDMHQHLKAYGGLLGALIDSAPLTPAERRRFTPVVHGYQRFLKRSVHPRTTAPPVWFEPPRRPGFPVGSGIGIDVSPAIGLRIEGVSHAIGPYFRADALTPERIAITNTLMHLALGSTWPGTVFAVLDVRRAKLYPLPTKATYLDRYTRLVRSSAACLSSLGGPQ